MLSLSSRNFKRWIKVGSAFLFARAIKGEQALVGFALAAFAIGKLVGGEALRVTRRAGFGGGLARNTPRRGRGLCICRDKGGPALRRAAGDRDCSGCRARGNRAPRSKYSRCALMRRARRGWVGSFSAAVLGVPGHVPGGHVPKENAARLERGDLAKQEQDAAPFRAFPGDVGADEKEIGHDRAEAAESAATKPSWPICSRKPRSSGSAAR